MSSCENEIFGSDPANIKWTIVRGDTCTLRVDFLNNDEVTYIDTDDWSYTASAYDKKTDIIDELEVESFEGYAIITAPAEITAFWGSTYSGIVAELSFDLQVALNDANDTIWTPVLGTISVVGNVSGNL